MEKLLRVAPLFETLDDLANSESAMRRLLENDWYRELIEGKQECMIGYSDSGKDAGRLAAAWGLYEVQVSCPRGRDVLRARHGPLHRLRPARCQTPVLACCGCPAVAPRPLLPRRTLGPAHAACGLPRSAWPRWRRRTTSS